MTALGIAAIAAGGTHLLYTSVAFERRDLGTIHRRAGTARALLRGWSERSGLPGRAGRDLLPATAILGLAGFALGLAVFGGLLPALATAAVAATIPATSARARHRAALAVAQEAWPRMIEEIRISTGSLGRSIPQALLDVGLRGPVEMRPAFEAARREWLMSTDFVRTVRVLKARLADPTADATCETLLVAHELGGTDLDRRLVALAEDRTQDVQGRKDARAKQAGVRFARRFVLIVPLGMALAGMSIGNGRHAYATPAGQIAVVSGLGLVACCWAWAGRLLRLPGEQRVFER